LIRVPNSPAFMAIVGQFAWVSRLPASCGSGSVGRRAAAELQVVNFSKCTTGTSAAKTSEGFGGIRNPRLLRLQTDGPGSYPKSSIFLKGKAHLVKGAQVAAHLAETSGHLVRKRRFLRQDPLIMALSGGSAELPMTLKKAAAPCRPSRCPRYAKHRSCRYDDRVY
jgi:hypothetical protein